jgi:Arc/MetJ-type ribon-helix-helix transcriptional regulator
MRTTMNISMPPALKREVEKAVKEGNYASMSEFFRVAFRAYKEQELYESIMQSEREIAAGKGKVLRSLRDLM